MRTESLTANYVHKTPKTSRATIKQPPAMDIHDYLLDHADCNWEALLTAWATLLPETFTVWFVNRFGDLFTVHDDGAVFMLDCNIGTYDRLANSRQEFADLLNVEANARQWLMIPLVDRCVAAGLELHPGSCYFFKVPATMGGAYDPSNIASVPMTEFYPYLTSLHDQTNHLPDNTQIRLRVK